VKLTLTWDEFYNIAIQAIHSQHSDLDFDTTKFMQHDFHERDSEAYRFPPDYVEFEVKKEKP
jgi:hypothetical protein